MNQPIRLFSSISSISLVFCIMYLWYTEAGPRIYYILTSRICRRRRDFARRGPWGLGCSLSHLTNNIHNNYQKCRSYIRLSCLPRFLIIFIDLPQIHTVSRLQMQTWTYRSMIDKWMWSIVRQSLDGWVADGVKYGWVSSLLPSLVMADLSLTFVGEGTKGYVCPETLGTYHEIRLSHVDMYINNIPPHSSELYLITTLEAQFPKTPDFIQRGRSL